MTQEALIETIDHIAKNAIYEKQIHQMFDILRTANPCASLQPASKAECIKYGFTPLSPESYLLKLVLDKAEELKK